MVFATKVLKILIPRVRKDCLIPSVLRVLNNEQMLNFIKCLSFIYWDKCTFSLLFCYCCSRSCCGPHQMNLSTSVYSSICLIASTCSRFPEDCDERCRGCSACAQSRLQGPGNEPHYPLSPQGQPHSTDCWQVWYLFQLLLCMRVTLRCVLYHLLRFPIGLTSGSHTGSWLDDIACLPFFVLPPPPLIMIQEYPRQIN